MLKIILSGACGRMGAQVTALAESRNVQIVAGVDVNPRADMPFPVYPAFSMVQEKVKTAIENMTGITVKEVSVHILGIDKEE